jgi:hypothetical protein
VVTGEVSVDGPDRREAVAAKAFAAGGAAVFAVGVLRRSFPLAMLGLAASGVGGATLARLKLVERSSKIREATEHVRADIEGLDPVARAQVLKDIAKDDIL